MNNLKKNLPKMITAVMAVYFIFFMSLGTRTFAQHVIRISNTPESRELAYELFGTVREATHAITRRARGAVSANNGGGYGSSSYGGGYNSSGYTSGNY